MGCTDWIAVAYDREKWRAVVNVVMDFSGSIKCGKIF
jgi:hypothetical protein